MRSTRWLERICSCQAGFGFFDHTTGKAVSMALTAAAQLAAVPAGAASDLNVQHWIDESVSAAQSTAYRKPPTGDGHGPFTLTSPWSQYLGIARRRSRNHRAADSWFV